MARACSDKTAAQVPVAAATAFNDANKAARAGDHAAAVSACRAALAAAPDLTMAHVLLARSQEAIGQTDAAIAAYRAALALDPAEFSAQLELGNLLRRKHDLTGTLDCYRGAVAARPDDWRGHLALAVLCQDDSLPKARWIAGRHYQAALQAARTANGAEGAAQVHQHMGRRRMALGDPAGASEAFRAAAACLETQAGPCSDALADVLVDLADALFHLDLEQMAIPLLERAGHAEGGMVLLRVAERSYRHNLWQEAIAILQRAVALHPDETDLHLALAEMQSKSWLLEPARSTLDGIADRLEPRHRQRVGLLRAQIANRMGDADGAIQEYEAISDLDAKGYASSLAMTALYSETADPERWAKRNRAAFAPWGKGARPVADFPNDRSVDRPLRIGMVTADLHRQHPVNLFLQPMLSRWNNQDFPLTLYHTGSTFDDQTRLAQSRVQAWRSLGTSELPAAVSADRIDILIDLSGHTHSAELMQFARRMAPVQATYLGYPGSTGVPNIDYLIGDPVVTPSDHAPLYSERLMPLDTAVFCYAPEADYPSPVFGADHLTRPLTFGSFNTITKINPHTMDLWARILLKVPDSRLLLKAPSFQDPGAQRRVRALFAERGIAPERLELRGPSGLADMMAEYGDVDICLDPMPYNGGTTTLQAMWMGVPVVTKAGAQFVARMGASFMTHAGLHDWVAKTDDEYVATAVRKAQDRQSLLELKKNLRNTLIDKPSWAIDVHIRGFEDCLKRIWIGGPQKGWEQA